MMMTDLVPTTKFTFYTLLNSQNTSQNSTMFMDDGWIYGLVQNRKGAEIV